MKRFIIALAVLTPCLVLAADSSKPTLEEEVARLREEVDALKKERVSAKSADVRYEDGVVIESGEASMKFGGFGQFDGRFVDAGGEQDSSLFIRRLRPEMRGKLPGDVQYRIVGEFAGSSARLIEGWADTPFVAGSRFRVGQFKEPFSLDEVTSAACLDMVERSMFASAFAPQEDIGAGLSGQCAGKTVKYDFGVFNGRGKNVDENNNDKDVAGRVVISPWSGSDGLLKGLSVGVNGTAGEQDEVLDGVAYRTAGRTKFFSFADDVKQDGNRTRVGADIAYLRGPGSVKAEWMQIDTDGYSLGSTNTDVRFTGWYVSATWLLTGETKVYNKQVVPSKPGWPGAWEVEARYESFEGGDEALESGLATGTDAVDASTLGLTWYPNKNIKVVGNVIHATFDEDISFKGEKVDSEDVVLVRLQYSL